MKIKDQSLITEFISFNDWKTKESLIYKNFNSEPSPKILGLDMDNTLITTLSPGRFPKDEKDWKFLYPGICVKLEEYYKKGYRLVIFTNQAGIGNKKVNMKEITTKLDSIYKKLKIPFLAFIASSNDRFRKPCTGMFEFLETELNGSIEINKEESLYVGDAAGRPKDHSCADYKFALNLKLPYYTPEHFFLGKEDNLELSFDPNTFRDDEINILIKPRMRNLNEINSNIKENTIKDNEFEKLKIEVRKKYRIGLFKKEIIIFVGSPGSGKSTFWKNYLEEYSRINQDTLKTFKRCVVHMRELCQRGVPIVIDNTNSTLAKRKSYIEVGKEYDYKIRIFWFNVEKNLAFHLNLLRKVSQSRKHLSVNVPKIAIHKFYKQLEEPKLEEEDVDEIVEIKFRSGPFENENDKKDFYSFITGEK